VIHNMAHARWASEECVLMPMDEILEHTPTAAMFVNPVESRTAEYIEGRYA
jgi:phosphate transport system ATP-binding protein